MAKANYLEYGYSASRGWYNSSVLENPSSPGTPTNPVASFANTSGYIVTQGEFPAPGAVDGSSNPGPYVSFPNGTLEFKAAFRVATDAERQAYETVNPSPAGITWRQSDTMQSRLTVRSSTWTRVGVLLSLHIIHKTPTAPYFIFATFEHKERRHGTGRQTGRGFQWQSEPQRALQRRHLRRYPHLMCTLHPVQHLQAKYLINATTPNVIEVPSQFNSATNSRQCSKLHTLTRTLAGNDINYTELLSKC